MGLYCNFRFLGEVEGKVLWVLIFVDFYFGVKVFSLVWWVVEGVFLC